ncbi:MAG TPA: TonB-dependent receptor [Bryobacteraceae bacterium]
MPFRICVFALSALPLAGFLRAGAPAELCGRTLDLSSRPVADASVTLYSRDSTIQLTTRSNGAGQYCFAQAPDGDYFLQAQATSLKTAAPQLVKIEEGLTQLPDLSLAITPVSSQVTVTATGFPQSASETSKELNVVDVAEATAQGRDSLVQAVNELPGLRVAQAGGPGSLASIQIRGLRSFDTSILIDGMRFRDNSATQGDAASFLSDLWFTDTTRVEVLQGAGSSLYGTNAMAGVVNLVTDTGGGPLHGDVDIQGGMLGQFFGKAHLAGSGLRNRLFYSMGFGHFDVTEGVEGNGRYRNTGGLGSLEFAVTPKLRVGARVIGADIFGQLDDDPAPLPPSSIPGGSIPAVPLPVAQIPAAVASISAGVPYAFGNSTFIPGYGDADNFRTVQFISTLAFLEHQIDPAFHYRLNFQDLDTNRNYVNGPAGLGYQPFDRTSTKYNSRTDTANATAEWKPIHSQLVSFGYEFERESYTSPSYVGQVPVFLSSSEATQSSNTAFVQDQTTLFNDRLRISLSGRWQGFDLSAPMFSGVFPVYASSSALSPPSALTGDASVAYFVRSSGTKIRSHVGNAYRAPSLYERFATYFDGSTFSAYGDPRLRPERAISLDAGIDQYFSSDKLKISVSYFYTRLQETIGYDPGNLITPDTDPYGRFSGYYNTHGGIARGVELSAEAKLPRSVIFRTAYTYTNSIDRISEYSSGLLQTPRIYPQTFTLTLMKQFGRHWDASFDFLAGSRFLFQLFDPLPPYSALAYSFKGPRQAGLSLGYTRPLGEREKLRIYTRLENLANQDYFENGFPTPGFVARGGVQFSF